MTTDADFARAYARANSPDYPYEPGQRPAPPRCEVADQIVPWPDVQPGDVVLWDGEFRYVEHIEPMDSGNPAFVLDGDTHNGTIPVGTNAAVRRYVETPAGQEG